jgi:hypothetical protein
MMPVLGVTFNELVTFEILVLLSAVTAEITRGLKFNERPEV